MRTAEPSFGAESLVKVALAMLVNDEICFVSVLVQMICVSEHTGAAAHFMPAANAVVVASSNAGLLQELIRSSSSFLPTCILWYSSGVRLDAGYPRAKLQVNIIASSR